MVFLNGSIGKVLLTVTQVETEDAMSISERAVAARARTREDRKPRYVARAKVGNGWVNIGAAWPLRSGEDGYSLKLTTIPLNWDGRLVLLPPLPNDNDLPSDE